MSRTKQNLLLLTGVILLTIYPLLAIKPVGEGTEIFSGADGQAEGVILQIAPDYQPWIDSLLNPPSGEIESLLFALQAALGAGFIGYYLGLARGRKPRTEEIGS
jgi:cobalt/nickel transport protein